MATRADLRGNRLLACLTKAGYQEILPALERVSLPQGFGLYESGAPERYVYFPTSSIVSFFYMLENGASAGLAVTGHEGMVGIPLIMGGETMPYRAVVLSAGYAYRLRGVVLKKAFGQGGVLRDLLLRYTQALIAQITQTAVCNRHHAIQQQLCRWLLLCLDRLSFNKLVMTQELIAHMLGVRREGITEAARRLQAREIIDYCRGHIAVLNRAKLEACVCECYAVVKREYDRLFPTKSRSGTTL